MNFQNEFKYICALRGATTSEDNSVKSITTAVEELLVELVSRNNLTPDQIISVTFSVTKDLDACFPTPARERKWHLPYPLVSAYESKPVYLLYTRCWA